MVLIMKSSCQVIYKQKLFTYDVGQNMSFTLDGILSLLYHFIYVNWVSALFLLVIAKIYFFEVFKFHKDWA